MKMGFRDQESSRTGKLMPFDVFPPLSLFCPFSFSQTMCDCHLYRIRLRTAEYTFGKIRSTPNLRTPSEPSNLKRPRHTASGRPYRR